jgi:hypothetical protein
MKDPSPLPLFPPVQRPDSPAREFTSEMIPATIPARRGNGMFHCDILVHRLYDCNWCRYRLADVMDDHAYRFDPPLNP